MADYSKSTVADLRKVLKERGIPSTGLTRKQQIVEKLEEWDRENAAGTEKEDTAEEGEASANEEGEKEMSEGLDKAQSEQAHEASAQSKAIQGEGQPQGDHMQGEEKDEPKLESAPAAIESRPETQAQSVAQGKTTASESVADAPSVANPVVSQDPAPTTEPLTTQTAEPAATQQSTAPSTAPLSRLTSEELAEESRKRKRRSATPPVSTAEIVQKKQKIDEDIAAPVHLKEDSENEGETQKIVETQLDAPVETKDPDTADDEMKDAATSKSAEDAPLEDSDAAMDMDASDDEEKPAESELANGTKASEIPANTPVKDQDDLNTEQYDKSAPNATLADSERPAQPSKASTKDARYKSLFSSNAADPLPSTEIVDTSSRDVTVALHPATPALYIRNLMRPIQPAVLRNHLIALATPPNSESDPDLLKAYYLDPIRTHAFAIFTSMSAASRVRNALHDVVWPVERTRKPLFVDFVPDDKVESWIETEEEAAREHGRMSRRWEVVYDRDEAIFQQEGANPRAMGAPAPRRPSVREDFNPPAGPRGNDRRPSDKYSDESDIHPSRRGLVQDSRDVRGPSFQDRSYDRPSAPSRQPRADTNANTQKAFKALEELFKFTTAKPKLYFLPVPDDVVKDRVDELDAETSRDWHNGKGARAGEELRKFAFDDERRVVDVGPLYTRKRGGGLGGGRGRGRGR